MPMPHLPLKGVPAVCASAMDTATNSPLKRPFGLSALRNVPPILAAKPVKGRQLLHGDNSAVASVAPAARDFATTVLEHRLVFGMRTFTAAVDAERALGRRASDDDQVSWDVSSTGFGSPGIEDVDE